MAGQEDSGEVPSHVPDRTVNAVSQPTPSPVAPEPPTCYRHKDRRAGAVCRRCDRPICADCMVEAPVGFQCRSCVKSGARHAPVTRYRPRATTLGGRITPVTGALVAVNVAVYLASLRNLDATIGRFGDWPAAIVSGHQYYRMFTAAFLHVSIPHIALNMLALAVMGPVVEGALGPTRFGALYLLSVLGGSACSYLLSPANVVGVGASGAIFGVFGAYVVLAREAGFDIRSGLVLIAVNLAFGFVVAGIDWRAHIGGLVVGCVAALVFSRARRLRRERRIMVEILACTATALVLVALVLALPPGHVNL